MANKGKGLSYLLSLIAVVACVFIPAMLASGAETVTHSYDDLNRLIRSEYSDGTTIEFEYDKIGNRTIKRKFYKPHVLTVQKTGAGTGTVTSSPARINCGSVCTETFSEGALITLTAVPDAGFSFIEWSGNGCSGSGSCTITLSADTTVEAIFQTVTCSNLPVRIGSTYYTGLQAAYNAASNGAVIQSQNLTLIEDLNISNVNITTVTLDGGYSCDFSTKTGATSLKGKLTTSFGTTTIKDFVLQQ